MKNINKKTIFTLFIALIVVVMLVAGYINSARGNEMVVTAMFPMTGGLSSYGDSASKAAIMAVEEINANGGINGKTLKLNVQDHKCDAKEAVAIYKQFNKTTKVFSSVACSGTVLAVAPSLEKDNSIFIATTATTPKITAASSNLFRNWATDAKEADLFVGVLGKLNIQSLGTLYEETDYAKGLKESVEKKLTAKKDVKLFSESFATGASDVRSQIAKLKADKVDAIFLSPQTVSSADIMISQMIDLKFKPKYIIVNDTIIKADALLKRYSAFLDGAYGGDYKLSTNSRTDEFMLKFKNRFGEDCKQANICLGEYDAIMMIAESLKNTDKSALQIKSYFKNVKYSGLSGEIKFDDNNDRSNADYTLFKVVNGTAIQSK